MRAPALLLALLVHAAVVLGGVALMLVAFGDELDRELDRAVTQVERDLDRELDRIDDRVRRELDARLPPATAP